MNLKECSKIFVLVSGGIDSTYLYTKLKKFYKEKVYPVNCYNPYEQSETLEQIKQDPNFIQIKPDEQYNYGQILRESFMKLPEAYKLKKQRKYSKKVFPCCYYIKHKAFMNNPLFKEVNSVVISGIKRGDGTQRRIWLTQMKNKNIFFHRHTSGQLYCYPFRDYTIRELPDICVKQLRKKYPTLDHSGCEICPVLVLFNIKSEKERYYKSLEYAHNLKVLPYKLIDLY